MTPETQSTSTTSTSPEPEAVSATADTPAATSVSLTPKAVEMIKHTRQQEGLDAGDALRVAVMGGGCSGFQYALDFEKEQRPTDQVLEYDGLRVLVDPVSARYLGGTVIDYVLGMQGAGFKFLNPNAVGSCGCGSSFAV